MAKKMCCGFLEVQQSTESYPAMIDIIYRQNVSTPYLGTMSFPQIIVVMKDLEYSTSGSVNNAPGGEKA